MTVRPRPQFGLLKMKAAPIYWSHAVVNILLGLFMVLMPRWTYGSTWFYFTHHGVPILPEVGVGMGICCITVGCVQVVAMLRWPTALLLSTLFGVSALVYWIAGAIFIAEGWKGHQGMMAGPFMLVIGAHKFIYSGSLYVYHHEAKRTGVQPISEPFLIPPAPIDHLPESNRETP